MLFSSENGSLGYIREYSLPAEGKKIQGKKTENIIKSSGRYCRHLFDRRDVMVRVIYGITNAYEVRHGTQISGYK